jgi:cation diffusion facilitator CzcD-associated flavoprotein CzcO
MSEVASNGSGAPRICVIGAGPCGLTSLKNLLQAGLGNVVCYDDSDAIGGNWAYSERTDRTSVYECTHIISSKRLSSFDDFPMPADYPDFPSHRQLLRYFRDYAKAFDLERCIRLGTRVESATLRSDSRWSLQVTQGSERREEVFDHLMICTGHHREPHLPQYPGTFSGAITHSNLYRRPDPFRGQRVLVVGAGNSACDISVDIARVAEKTCISMREGTYIMPKLMFGHPIDEVYAFFKSKIPKPVFQRVMRWGLWLSIGPWENYGLQTPTCEPLEQHPTLNTSILEALRHGKVLARVGIERFDGSTVYFRDGRQDDFDTIVMATGYHTVFPFLPASVVDWDTAKPPPLYLKMMHRSIPSLYFIGLFQPIGCIWQLADYQARIAAWQIQGRLQRPADIAARVGKEVASPHWRFRHSPRHAIEVDYHDFRRELLGELAAA